MFENIRELSTRAERTVSYEHLRIIVISDKVARSENLNNIVNFLIRNTETRRSIRVAISQGKAREAFVKRGIVKNPSLEIRELTDNYRTTLKMAPEIKLGDMSENLTGKSSFIVQRVDTSRKEAKIAGAAAIKGDTAKIAGWLSEDELAGLNLLKGEGKNLGIITGADPESGQAMVYEIRTLKSRISPQVNGDTVSFAVDIATEGKLREDWVYPGDTFEKDFIHRAVQATVEAIRNATEKVLSKMKKDLKVDVAGFGKKLSIKYPQMWKRMKKDWDRKFSEMQVDVKVNVKIQEFGTKGAKKG